MIEIKNRFTGEIIISGKYYSKRSRNVLKEEADVSISDGKIQG